MEKSDYNAFPVPPKLSERDPSICYYYEKTGSCAREDFCQFHHLSIPMARCLLFHHLYPNPDLFSSFLEESDFALSEEKKNDAFDAFFMDIYQEFRLFGKIEDLFVAGNLAQNSHGNVYIRFLEADSAAACHKAMEGRYYAGRIVHSSYVPHDKLSKAVCFDKNCIHGKNCNFVHPMQPSKHVLIQCFPRVLKTTPEPLRLYKEYPYMDSPYELLQGRSKFLQRIYNYDK